MATLLLRLAGPLQSWGITSRFNQRDTEKEPSKSGVIGLVAAALGIDRENWKDLEPFTLLAMGVRHDRPGTLMRDYQTAGCAASDSIIKADGVQSKEGVTSDRFYLADAVFLVGLEGNERSLLTQIQAALQNPVWPLALGRKSYMPSEPIWICDGLREEPLREALEHWPWIAAKRKWEEPPEKLLMSLETGDGTGALRMDQPRSAFSERRFGIRFVCSEWIPFPGEVSDVPSQNPA